MHGGRSRFPAVKLGRKMFIVVRQLPLLRLYLQSLGSVGRNCGSAIQKVTKMNINQFDERFLQCGFARAVRSMVPRGSLRGDSPWVASAESSTAFLTSPWIMGNCGLGDGWAHPSEAATLSALLTLQESLNWHESYRQRLFLVIAAS